MLGDGAANRPRHREDFVLQIESSQLRGQVLAPDGGPPGVVELHVVDGTTRRRTVTDAAGRFTIERVVSGNYVLEAASADYPATRLTMRTESWTEVRLDSGGSLRCDLRDVHTAAALGGIRIEDTGPNHRTASAVTDARGIADLRALTLVVRDRYGRRVAGARVWTDGTTTQSDADGNFRLTDAPSGSRWLEAELDGVKGGVQLELAPGAERLTVGIELTQ